MINNRLLALSLIVFSTGSLANSMTFEEGTIVVPNESVSSFEVTDLDNNGVKDLVYVTTAGELKYAKQKGGNAEPVPGGLIEITKESAEKYLLNSRWKDNHSRVYTITTTSEGKSNVSYPNGSNQCEYNVFANGLHFDCYRNDMSMSNLKANTVMINGQTYTRD